MMQLQRAMPRLAFRVSTAGHSGLFVARLGRVKSTSNQSQLSVPIETTDSPTSVSTRLVSLIKVEESPCTYTHLGLP
jgi:hypothetical protein